VPDRHTHVIAAALGTDPIEGLRQESLAPGLANAGLGVSVIGSSAVGFRPCG
jgi:hypothetical protein